MNAVLKKAHTQKEEGFQVPPSTGQGVITQRGRVRESFKWDFVKGTEQYEGKGLGQVGLHYVKRNYTTKSLAI